MKKGSCFIAIFVFVSALLSTGGDVRADSGKYRRTIENYQPPDVTLVNQNGRRVALGSLLNSGKPVLIQFIYTTCTTICPLLSIGFSDFQKKLGRESEKVQLLSISIDPEHDTPQAMKAYLQRYGAQPGWDFLTGTKSDINRVLSAFGAYTPDKMSHSPLILLKSPGGTAWVRIYGLLGTRDLMKEYQAVLK